MFSSNVATSSDITRTCYNIFLKLFNEYLYFQTYKIMSGSGLFREAFARLSIFYSNIFRGWFKFQEQGTCFLLISVV